MSGRRYRAGRGQLRLDVDLDCRRRRRARASVGDRRPSGRRARTRCACTCGRARRTPSRDRGTRARRRRRSPRRDRGRGAGRCAARCPSAPLRPRHTTYSSPSTSTATTAPGGSCAGVDAHSGRALDDVRELVERRAERDRAPEHVAQQRRVRAFAALVRGDAREPQQRVGVVGVDRERRSGGCRSRRRSGWSCRRSRSWRHCGGSPRARGQATSRPQAGRCSSSMTPISVRNVVSLASPATTVAVWCGFARAASSAAGDAEVLVHARDRR